MDYVLLQGKLTLPGTIHRWHSFELQTTADMDPEYSSRETAGGGDGVGEGVALIIALKIAVKGQRNVQY